MTESLTTKIATSDETSITWRGMDLVHDLLGEYTFTEVLYFLMMSRMPNETERKVLDVCLVTLMEHGMTPHAIVTRLVRDCNPQQVQIAMAAGLTCVGDVFAGTMDGCGRLLAAGLQEDDKAAWCRRVVSEHKAARKPMPGFGHNMHRPDDPRSPKLFEVALKAGVGGEVIALLKQLSAEVDAQYGRHLTINATGALAALMLEIGIPVSILRCIAVVSRAGGLVAHVREDQETQSGRQIWINTDAAFTYVG
jgi:citrate synthase